MKLPRMELAAFVRQRSEQTPPPETLAVIEKEA